MLFGRLQWILPEKWYYHSPEIARRSNTKAIQMLFVIILATIDMNTAAREEVLQQLQSRQALCSLSYNELRENLPAQSHNPTTLNCNGEATLSIHKTNDPTDCF